MTREMSTAPKLESAAVEKFPLSPAQLGMWYAQQLDPAGQDHLRELFADRFKTKTRDEWTAIFEGTDACTTPVLTFTEATENEHIVARNGLIEIEEVVQHAPAPRFSRTPGGIPTPPPSVATPIETVWAD